MAKVAVILANGFEEIEALTVVDVLRRANISCDMVGFEEQVTGSHGIQVKANRVFDGDLSDYDLVVLPGGMPGSAHLRDNPALISEIQAFDQAGKKIAAICAAPMVLGKHGILKGHRATCYPGFEHELEGAEHVNDLVVEDGHIITAKGPRAAVDFAFAIASRFVDATTIARVKSDMLFL